MCYCVSENLYRVALTICDEAFAYNKIYGCKAIQEKGVITNIIENINSQLIDKVYYLVRRFKPHAKSELWLNYRLARFFNNKNLGG